MSISHDVCFFFNDTAPSEIYTYGHTLSLHDALPIYTRNSCVARVSRRASAAENPGTQSSFHSTADPARRRTCPIPGGRQQPDAGRSEEHTSELQSLMRISYAVFCLKKNNNNTSRKRTKYDNNIE